MVAKDQNPTVWCQFSNPAARRWEDSTSKDTMGGHPSPVVYITPSRKVKGTEIRHRSVFRVLFQLEVNVYRSLRGTRLAKVKKTLDRHVIRHIVSGIYYIAR